MDKNKTKKYFKYALGEIALVVIGILLALQINTWNENRKNTNKLESYLSEIIDDLKADTLGINNDIVRAQYYMQTTKAFLALNDYKDLSIDSLEKSLETFYTTLSFNNSAFKKIESSGITDFGEYAPLIEKLKNYYNDVIPANLTYKGTHNRAVDLEDNYWRYGQNVYEFTYNTELESFQSKEESRESLISLLRSPTARNILKIDYRRNLYAIDRLNILNEKITKLLKAAEKKLSEKK